MMNNSPSMVAVQVFEITGYLNPLSRGPSI